MEGNRLVRVVSLEVMGMRGKVRRIENLKQNMEEIGWMDVGMEEMGWLSNIEVIQMLRDCIWRPVKKELNSSSRTALQVESGEGVDEDSV